MENGSSTTIEATNPLIGFIVGRMEIAFLKSGSMTNYYEALNVNKHASIAAIKSSYKTRSIQLHPDKIRQKEGREATEEEKARFLEIKEAYQCLSDPKKRRRYDRIGAGGIKMEESGDYQNILNNFAANKSDRCFVISILVLVFATLLAIPILVCLKVDGDMDTTWVSLWTPAWLFDAFLLFDTVFGLCNPPELVEVDEEGRETRTTVRQDFAALAMSLLGLLVVGLFVLFQVVLMLRLDGTINSSWWLVLAPWFAVELIRVIVMTPGAYFKTLEKPEMDDEVTAGLGEDGETMGAEELKLQMNLQKYLIYYNDLYQQVQDQKTCVACVLRLAQGLLLAAQLQSNNSMNWGLVFLPVWIYLFLQTTYAVYWSNISMNVSADLDVQNMQTDTDPDHHGRLQFSAFLGKSACLLCLCQIWPILIAVLLVVSLQSTKISAFVIVLPIWISAGTVLCCGGLVLCCMQAMGGMDLQELQRQMAEEAARQATSDMENGGYKPPSPEDSGNAASSASEPFVVMAPNVDIFPPPAPENENPLIPKQAPTTIAPTTIDSGID